MSTVISGIAENLKEGERLLKSKNNHAWMSAAQGVVSEAPQHRCSSCDLPCAQSHHPGIFGGQELFGPPHSLCDWPLLGLVLLGVTPGVKEVEKVTEGQVGVQGKICQVEVEMD